MNVRTGFVFFSILILILTALIHLIWEPIKWTLIFTIPLILIGFYDLTQKKPNHTSKLSCLGAYSLSIGSNSSRDYAIFCRN